MMQDLADAGFGCQSLLVVQQGKYWHYKGQLKSGCRFHAVTDEELSPRLFVYHLKRELKRQSRKRQYFGS